MSSATPAMTAEITLASRREQLLLKRWRSSQARATSVLAGSVGLLAVLLMLQAVALTSITMAVSGQRPASLVMLGVGTLAGVATIGALTFLVATFTRSAEHAMLTTFPVIALMTGATIWALTRPFDALDWAVLALPGGAATQLVRLGWDGPSVPATGPTVWLLEAAPSLGAAALLTAVAAAAAIRWFPWERRS